MVIISGSIVVLNLAAKLGLQALVRLERPQSWTALERKTMVTSAMVSAPWRESYGCEGWVVKCCCEWWL